MGGIARKLTIAFAVVALSTIAFARRTAAQAQQQPSKSIWSTTKPKSAGKPHGYVQYQEYCVICHGEGTGKPGTLALQARYKGSKPAVLAERTDLTPQLIEACVRHGIGPMPFFRKTEISDADLQAITSYLTRKKEAAAH